MRLTSTWIGATLWLLALAAASAPAAEVPGRPVLSITHAPGINAMALSPDGRTLATAGADATARLWDAGSGALLRELKGHEGRLTGVVFARDGNVVVTGGADGAVRVWNAANGRALKEMRTHVGEVRALAVSGDGRRVASGGADKTICLWDAADGSLLRQIRPYTYKAGDNPEEGAVECLDLSPDGSLVASGHRKFDYKVHVWDAATGAELTRFEEESSHVAAVRFSRDGACLATVGSRGQAVHLWETATWRLRRRLKLSDLWESPAAFSPDGACLATGAAAGVRLWDLAAGERVAHLSGGHQTRVTGVAFFPDGRRVASAAMDGTLLVRDVPPRTPSPGTGAEPLTASRLEQLWADLSVEDAARSYDAILALAAAPAQGVPFLAQRVQPDEPVDERKVRQWVRELDDESFVRREGATRELGRVGEAAEPFLRAAMARGPSVEVAQRVEVLLAAIHAPVLDADALRALRAVEALERAGTPEAARALGRLAAGAGDTRLKRRARMAAGRLGNPAHP